MENYLTIREVGDLLKVSERTVRRWIGAGELPAVKIGRSVRVRQEDIGPQARKPARRSSGQDAQLSVLARARHLRREMAVRRDDSAGSSAEILRAIRLERARVR